MLYKCAKDSYQCKNDLVFSCSLLSRNQRAVCGGGRGSRRGQRQACGPGAGGAGWLPGLRRRGSQDQVRGRLPPAGGGDSSQPGDPRGVPARGANLGGIFSCSSSRFEVRAPSASRCVRCGPGGDGTPQTGQVSLHPPQSGRRGVLFRPKRLCVGTRADSGVDLGTQVELLVPHPVSVLQKATQDVTTACVVPRWRLSFLHLV